MTNELKRCPFCGGKASVTEHRWSGHGEGGVLYRATCGQCGAEVPARNGNWPYNQQKAEGEVGAAEAWNQRAVPEEGFVMVPREPTDAMLDAAIQSMSGYPRENTIRHIYKAMLDAASPMNKERS